MKKALAATALLLLVLLVFSPVCAEESSSALHLPAALTSIGGEAFAGTAVEEVYLPEKLVAVEQGAFAEIPGLSGIHFRNNTLLLAEAGAVRLEGTLPVPAPEVPLADQPFGLLPGQARTDSSEKTGKKVPAVRNEAAVTEEDASGRSKADHPREYISRRPQERTELQPVNYSFP